MEFREFRLRAVFGVEPAVYLFWLLAGLVAAGLLWAGVAAARRPREHTMVSMPSFAAIEVVGHGEGVAPYTTRLRPGSYEVRVTHPDYEEGRHALVVRGGLGDLFGSGRVVLVRPQMGAREAGDVVEDAAEEAAQAIAAPYARVHRWALTGVDQLRYQKPAAISAAVESLVLSSGSAAAERLLLLSARDVGGAMFLADWTRGLATLHSHPTPLMPHEIVAAARMASAVLHDNPRAEALVEEMLAAGTDAEAAGNGASAGSAEEAANESTANESAARALRQSEWRAGLIAAYREQAERTDAQGAAFDQISVAGIEMIRIPAGQVFIESGASGGGDGGASASESGGGDVHPLANVALTKRDTELYIAAYEVTVGEFGRFLAQNPRWRAENRARLIADGVADKEYLRALEAGEAGAEWLPITGVSWHAAVAYCRWLQGQLPPAFAAYEVRLPTEREWLYAAYATGAQNQAALSINSGVGGASGVGDAPRSFYDRAAAGDAAAAALPKNMLGSVWEWNANIFHVAGDYFDRPSADELRLPVEVRPLKGGSLITNRELSGDIAAALYSASTSDYIGFRPVLARE